MSKGQASEAAAKVRDLMLEFIQLLINERTPYDMLTQMIDKLQVLVNEAREEGRLSAGDGDRHE